MLRLRALSASLQDIVGRPWHGQTNHVFGLAMFTRLLANLDHARAVVFPGAASSPLASWAKVCAAYAVRVSGHIVSRHEDSKAATASQLVGNVGTDAAAFARCSLGPEAVSVSGHVTAVCSD